MWKRVWVAYIVAFVPFLAVGCQSTSDDADDPLLQGNATIVYTVNYPLQYFSERIGGEYVKARFPAPQDADLASWAPDLDGIVGYQDADLMVLNGAGFAKWTEVTIFRESKMLNSSKQVEDRYIPIEDSVTDSHGPGGEHSHEGFASTVWLDLEIAKVQAEAIAEFLKKLRPEEATVLQKNLDSLTSDLTELDEAITAATKDAPSQPVLFSHPVYQYLTRRYKLNAKSVHWEPDELPSDKEWAELAKLLEAHPAKWMIWEADPLEESANRLAEMGVKSAVFNPCANRPKDGDWLKEMRHNVSEIERVFSISQEEKSRDGSSGKEAN